MRRTMRPLIFSGKAVAVRPEPAAILTKNRLVVAFQIKADDVDEEERTFEGLAAVYDLDLGGDVIHKGAFKKTLSTWKKSGEAMPLLNSHDHYDIFSSIGQLIEAEERPEGLWTKWEVIEGTDGDRVLSRIRPSKRTKRAVVGKMSIGYEPLKFDFEQSEGDGPFDRIRNLREVNLKEVSLVLFPMAPGASIDVSSVKAFADAVKDTDPQSLSTETKQDLRRLASRIGHLLSGKKTEGEQTPPVGDPPPAPAPVVAPAPAVGDPAPSSPATEPPAPIPTAPSGDPEPGATSTADSGTEEQGSKSAVYLYGEALQQRLQATLLKSKVSNIKNPNTN